MKFRIILIAFLLVRVVMLGLSCESIDRGKEDARQSRPFNEEVVYHICLRSFHDSDGDGHGDFKGLHQKLDYIEELGVTSILFLPLDDSIYDHLSLIHI